MKKMAIYENGIKVKIMFFDSFAHAIDAKHELFKQLIKTGSYWSETSRRKHVCHFYDEKNTRLIIT